MEQALGLMALLNVIMFLLAGGFCLRAMWLYRDMKRQHIILEELVATYTLNKLLNVRRRLPVLRKRK